MHIGPSGSIPMAAAAERQRGPCAAAAATPSPIELPRARRTVVYNNVVGVHSRARPSPGPPRAQHACVRQTVASEIKKKIFFSFACSTPTSPRPPVTLPFLTRARACPCFEPTGTHAFADGPGRADVISPVYQGRGYSVSYFNVIFHCGAKNTRRDVACRAWQMSVARVRTHRAR